MLGPETRFATRVVAGGKGRIVLVGGGDPFLASKPLPAAYPERADVETLAAQTAAVLRQQGRTKVRLGYDDSLFSEPSFNPAWPAHYLPEHVVSRVTALWVDEGRPAVGSGRVDDPSLYAAQTFAAALAANGIKSSARRRTAWLPAAGTWRRWSPRRCARSWRGSSRSVTTRAPRCSPTRSASRSPASAPSPTAPPPSSRRSSSLGVPTAGVSIHDGSGLSRENLITPLALVGVLRAVLDPAHPELNAVATGLPVAGFNGSLTNRFDQPFPDSRGLVRAKTGTLTNVSSLAGIAVDQDGHQMLFALMADRIAQARRDQGPARAGRRRRRARRLPLWRLGKLNQLGRL